MGFFSKILGGIVKIARGVFGPAATVAAAVAPVAVATRGVAARAASTVARGFGPAARAAGRFATSPVVAAGAAGLAVGAFIPRRPGTVGTAQLDVPGAPGLAALGRGNGQFVKQTVVQTIDLMTGTVVREELLQGAPFLMNNDVRKLRSTAKKLNRAAGRLPRRTVTPSKSKQLTDAVTDAALRGVVRGCPGE